MRRHIWRVLSPVSVSAVVAAHLWLGLSAPAVRAQETPPEAVRPRPATSTPRPMVTPAPPKALEDETQYRYEGQGRRDPLEPLVKPAKDKPPDVLRPKSPGTDRPLGPLERFDISSLKLVGIVWGDLGRRALIKAPDGKGYFATLETYIGKYSGKVITIDMDRLVVEEQYVNSDEKIVPKTLIIPLRRKDKKEG